MRHGHRQGKAMIGLGSEKNTLPLHASTSRLTFSNLEQTQDYDLIFFSNVAINAEKKIASSHRVNK